MESQPSLVCLPVIRAIVAIIWKTMQDKPIITNND